MDKRDGGQSKTIMVVDDYDEVRAITKQVLEKAGYRVLEATNGEEAIEMARLQIPDLILMDLSMPQLDGFTAIHRIRRLVGLGDVPIIAFSAHAASEVRDDALAAGCCDFILKPTDIDKLIAVVERQLTQDDACSSPPVD